MEQSDIETDVVVIGSGSGALSAALRASAGGLRVVILEKADVIGGTTAMSGAGTWIPANHHARNAGFGDSVEEAIAYLRSAAPGGWREHEDALWTNFAINAPKALKFIEDTTPLEFALTEEPDVFVEAPGGKKVGRMLSPKPLSKHILGKFKNKIRSSTLPHIFTYQEVYIGDLYHRPIWTGFRFAHKLAWRLLTKSRAQGSALVTGLLKGCLDQGCTIETGTRVTELVTNSDGFAVTGVVAETAAGLRRYRALRGVVIASGGFEWNEEMRKTYFAGPLDYLGSPRTNEGDGQKMAAAVGAHLAHMDQANVYPTMPTRYEGKSHGIPLIFQAEHHAIVVNRHGRRFVSEYDFNIGEAIDKRDPNTGEAVHLPAWVIADKRFLSQALPFLWYSRKAPNWLRKARSLGELARRIGLPAAELERTVARYNGFCAAGKDQDFGRGESEWEQFKAGGKDAALATVEKGPFYAMPFNRSILGTKGGARTNEHGQVLREDGSLISGLYAAGLAMANPIGTRAVGPGTTIGPNLTWGYICGEALLRDNRVQG
ncbi:MAG: FAD-binding protein [Rhizobiales bacterium]|nr:FAD-binding protein [Hyphomicrobiales bacterium]